MSPNFGTSVPRRQSGRNSGFFRKIIMNIIVYTVYTCCIVLLPGESEMRGLGVCTAAAAVLEASGKYGLPGLFLGHLVGWCQEKADQNRPFYRYAQLASLPPRRLMALFFILCAQVASSALELIDLQGVCTVNTVELEQRAQAQFAEKMRAAGMAGELGCRQHCQRLEAIFARLTQAAATQGASAQKTDWRLAVIRSAGEAAYALPGGHIVISEAFIDALQLSDDELAFVLAHEISHVLLQHECELLDVAQGIALPRGINRDVADIYAEMDFDMGLLLNLEPVMTQSEFEADYTGMLIASVADFAPENMLGFMEKTLASESGAEAVVNTHPASVQRLDRLRSLLPLAKRVRELAN